jgi:hypothetical protein
MKLKISPSWVLKETDEEWPHGDQYFERPRFKVRDEITSDIRYTKDRMTGERFETSQLVKDNLSNQIAEKTGHPMVHCDIHHLQNLTDYETLKEHP